VSFTPTPSIVRPLNPRLAPYVHAHAKKEALQTVAGFPYIADMYEILRLPAVIASPSNVLRLQRIARAVRFPDPIFLDGDPSR
jgi:hypothetical protein